MTYFIDQKFIFIFFVSILVTFFSILLFRPFAIKLGILDRPSERKTHSGEIPLIGGISIFIGFYISMLGEYSDNNILIIFMVSGFLILVLGFIDDCYPLSVITRISLQIVIVSSMVWFTGLKIETFGNSFGLINQISLGYFGFPITVLGIVFVTNAYNLMDGSDGLASSLCFLALISIIVNDILYGNFYFNPISIALTGCLIPFLWFNLIKSNKNKIFLGDSGSLFLGYIISCLLLYKTQITKNISPTYALWIIAIPVFDAITVMLYRKKQSYSLFSPDRSHLHHFLERLGISNRVVLLLVIGFGALIAFFGFLIEKTFRFISLPIFLLLFLIYVWLRVFSSFSKYNK